MSTTTDYDWDQSYPPGVLRPVVPVTGATAGTPGAWVPADAYPLPASVAEANALGLSLGAAWTAGQYVILDNPSRTHTHWNGTAFASGNAPALPTATSIAPTSGSTAGGTVVTVTGTGMTACLGIALGAEVCTAFTVVSPTSARGTSAAHAAGVVDVVVGFPTGNITLTGAYTYTAPPLPAPTITTVTPTTGPAGGGDQVILAGTDFTGSTGVTFGGVAGGAFVVNSATQITCASGPHAAGVVDVVVLNPRGNATKAGGFTYE